MTPRTFMVYEIVTCTQCAGKKVIPPRDVPCPKCNGTGNVYAPIDLAEALKAFMVDVYLNDEIIDHLGIPSVDGYGKIVQKEPKEEQ